MKISLEIYKPTKEEREIIDKVYQDINSLVRERNKTWRQFNDRTLIDYIDDSEKRLNSYILSREEQNKEEWQANVALPTIRNKLKKMIAGFSLQVPDLEVKSFNLSGEIDFRRAEIAKNLIKSSYLQEENPILENFWEAWECATKGTVVKYEGYLKTRYKQKYIKSYDLATGEIEFEEREVDVDDKCVSFIVPLSEFYIKDFYVPDVQDQPYIAWIRYYDEDVFEYEFSKYPNAKYVRTSGSVKLSESETASFFYQKHWEGRAGKNKVEVIRYYNKLRDEYIIVANGVLLLNAPLLWKSNGVKVYPFAKTIWEPFGGKHFFYGKSLPDVLTGEYDILNTLFNTTLDKEFRSLVKPLLIGRINQDALELEDEWITRSTKIYLEDINQVKELSVEGVTNADVAMLQLVARGIEETAPSLPDLLAKRQATAREVVLAEEKLKEIKSLYYEMMTDLWRQKYYLRLANIQMNYPQPRKIVDENGKEKIIYRTYLIPNAVLDEATGERGILAIQFRKFSPGQKREIQREIDIEEARMGMKNIKYKKLILSPDYLDNFIYQIEIVPESLYKISLAKMQATILEKLETIAKMFPQIFVLNQEEYFSQLSKAYDDNPEGYLEKLEKFKQALAEQEAKSSPPISAGELPETTGGTMTEGEMILPPLKR